MSLYSLPDSQRLSKKDISGDEILSKKSKELVLILKKNNQSYGRMKVIVPKKYLAKSTRRNQVKRWVRESFRLNQSSFKGKDLIVIARYQVAQINYHKCLKAVQSIAV